MKNIWKQLPDDIVNEILSYGDPEVYKKFKLVTEKIETLKKEFQILRKGNGQEHCWYRHPETHFLYYALRCCFIKKVIDRRAKTRRIQLKQLVQSIPHFGEITITV